MKSERSNDHARPAQEAPLMLRHSASQDGWGLELQFSVFSCCS